MAEYFVLVVEFQLPFEPKKATVYVKDGDFFRFQGGHIQEWGKDWRAIEAASIEDARRKAWPAAVEAVDA